jgi:hypothetical protein
MWNASKSWYSVSRSDGDVLKISSENLEERELMGIQEDFSGSEDH